MSASSTPIFRPRFASAAARLTVTEDLPTPPLPDATQITLVVGASAVPPARSLAFQRALPIASVRCCWVISVQVMATAMTPAMAATRVLTSFWIWARSGQPAVVSATVTVTLPSGATTAPRAIPRSTMSLPNSGSMTPRSMASTSASVGSVYGHDRNFNGLGRVIWAR